MAETLGVTEGIMDTDLIHRDTLWNLITLVSILLCLLNIREIYFDFVDSGKALANGKYLDFLARRYKKTEVPKSTVRSVLSFILFLILMILGAILFIQKDYLPLNIKDNLQKTHNKQIMSPARNSGWDLRSAVLVCHEERRKPFVLY